MQTTGDEASRNSDGSAATAEENGEDSNNALRRGKRSRSDSNNNDEETATKPSPARARLPSLDSDKDSKPKSDGYDSLELLSTRDRRKFIAADSRRKEDARSIISAQSHIVELRENFNRVQAELEKAQKKYDDARALSQKHSEQVSFTSH